MPLRARWCRPLAENLTSQICSQTRPQQTPFAIHRRTITALPLTRAVQIYISSSHDPYLNLSLEHHLLQRSHPESTILFLYNNKPCVVIGRNQNPWLEVNLPLLRKGLPDTKEPISLVRRRSGGGTVFHDLGNANWSVICPPAAFDRDKHALMVVRALQSLSVPNVRVNERHDIVQDHPGGGKEYPTYKVSGSAYKLTRTRSLHHGTMLLSSDNLHNISGLLRGPAEKYIKAKGVESVRSPIQNVGVEKWDSFAAAVLAEFKQMYDKDGTTQSQILDEQHGKEIEDVVKGNAELTNPDWIYGQTPQFTVSTHPTEDDPRDRPPSNFNIHLNVRHGEITAASISGLEWRDIVNNPEQDVNETLVGQKVYKVKDWRPVLDHLSSVSTNDTTLKAGEWLNLVFAAETEQ
ncbi:hypothetical protein QBC35DRAFT_502879 [Podospora australis]|uniref:Putative lipoate-protein ligase A n=1 Tax=Podospora australis TaxID=1536484 RepID=A0AAN6WQE4_9PEZI|nr:hypothetical protein QBC35DRAFT_502879 [Podospora australis]